MKSTEKSSSPQDFNNRMTVLENRVKRQNTYILILLSLVPMSLFLGWTSIVNSGHGRFSGTFIGRVITDEILLVDRDSLIRGGLFITNSEFSKDSAVLCLGVPSTDKGVPRIIDAKENGHLSFNNGNEHIPDKPELT